MKKQKFKGIIAWDFDCVIASYRRPFREDILGKPDYEVIETMNYYWANSYYVLIYTGRENLIRLRVWLKKYKVKYNGINTNPCKYFNIAESYKPYFHVLVDDKSVNYHFSRNKKTSKELIKEINKVFKWSQK